MKSAPAPGQTPEDVASMNKPKDWPKAGQCLRVPQVVFISIFPDPTVFSNSIDTRYDYANSLWNYPTPRFPGMQTNFQALPWANFGLGRSLLFGAGNPGWHNIGGSPKHVNYFVEFFDTAYNGKQWPATTVPIRYESGSAQNPEPSYYANMLAIANQVKQKIEASRPGKTFVQIQPWVPPQWQWQDSPFQETFPVMELHPGQNFNVISPLFEGILPNAGTLAFGGWSSSFIQTSAIAKYSGITPPQEIWYKLLDQKKYTLPWVDFSLPNNQIPWNYSGPAELMIPNPFQAKSSTFFGCDFLHIYIGYRAWTHGRQLDDSLWMGNLHLNDVEAIYDGSSINDCATAAALGFETTTAKFGQSTGDILNIMWQNQNAYRGHRTMVFGMPTGLGWGNSIRYVDPRFFEQNKYFYGAELHGGLNPNLYQPSFFNSGDPDFFIEGLLPVFVPPDHIEVDFDYLIEERYPPNNSYTVNHGFYNPLSPLEMYQQAAAKMKMFWSELRAQYGDAFWRANFALRNSQPAQFSYASNNVSYEGTANGLDATTLEQIIENHYGFTV